MQSDLLPSACIVELPSNPQRGMSARVGVLSKLLICVLPRSSGMGFLRKSQMYSKLYVDIDLLMRWEGWDRPGGECARGQDKEHVESKPEKLEAHKDGIRKSRNTVEG